MTTPVGDALHAILARNQMILDAYTAAPDQARARTVFELRAVCGCLLLRVWLSPLGYCFYRPAYRVAPGRNADTSTESGRAANTTDGSNHYRHSAGVLDDHRDWPDDTVTDLACAHKAFQPRFADLLSGADEGKQRLAAKLGPVRRVVD